MQNDDTLSAQEWTLLGVLENLDLLTENEKDMNVEEWITFKIKQLKMRTER
jgi:hypothetical protein